MTQNSINFTVVIPSRNRPALLKDAVRSVLKQTHLSFEIIIVNDGSSAEHEAEYARIASQSGQITLINLESTRSGHGPSYAINRGAEKANGLYICFLDDDDTWTDAQHLERAWLTLSTASQPVDLYTSNQKAYKGETQVEAQLWLESLTPAIQQCAQPDEQGTYPVTLGLLMTLHGFPHLNNTIVKRELYRKIGGMDENIRYECEWDLYFRIADKSANIRYFPGIVSRHNVPDRSKTINASTAVSDMQKLLFRMYVMDKALLFCASTEIIKAAAEIKVTTLKNITAQLVLQKKYKRAYPYARSALACRFTIKWFLYSIFLGFQAIFSP